MNNTHIHTHAYGYIHIIYTVGAESLHTLAITVHVNSMKRFSCPEHFCRIFKTAVIIFAYSHGVGAPMSDVYLEWLLVASGWHFTMNLGTLWKVQRKNCIFSSWNELQTMILIINHAQSS